MRRWLAVIGLSLLAALTVLVHARSTAQNAATAIAVDEDDIAGVVSGPRGPEAGVWVIAETGDLPTTFVRIVVTDDEGRYLVPDLPKASYRVWTRGYGLVDSEKVPATPGRQLALTAAPAPDARAAARYYPAGYWFSLLEPPNADEFPGTGPAGNGISPEVKSQGDWLRTIKSGNCLACHALGTRATREIPPALGVFPSSRAAWERRLQSGQAGMSMIGTVNHLGPRAITMFADWTDRIAKGEVPPAPPRPRGIERTVVITEWDWADPKAYLHDEVSTDRRNPTLNANGKIYGALEESADYLPVLDPVTHTASRVPLTVRDPNTPARGSEMPQPSSYWGNEPIWTSRNNVHTPMFDHKGRVWITSAVRPPDNPDFCKEGSTHPSAKVAPVGRAFRHLAVYDPATKKLTHISTCFSTHHLMFAEDENHTLWTSGGGSVVGWLNTKLFDETGDAAASQGWSAFVLDTNGNGRRDESDSPVSGSNTYAVMPNPADGSVWYTVRVFAGRGAVMRFDPDTQLSEIYHVALPGFAPRGGDIDKSGVVWVSLGSGHLGSFDRRKCKGPLNGPKATGDHCPEGWAFHQYPGPGFKGIGKNSAESSYYTWVDQHDTLGLGEDVPMSTANLQDGLVALKDGRMILLRVPYPLGFYAKGFDGRIDDPNAGWKGRGLWTASGDRAPWLREGGKGSLPLAVHFQLRKHPLER